jgi:hypothetical protein
MLGRGGTHLTETPLRILAKDTVSADLHFGEYN